MNGLLEAWWCTETARFHEVPNLFLLLDASLQCCRSTILLGLVVYFSVALLHSIPKNVLGNVLQHVDPEPQPIPVMSYKRYTRARSRIPQSVSICGRHAGRAPFLAGGGRLSRIELRITADHELDLLPYASPFRALACEHLARLLNGA